MLSSVFFFLMKSLIDYLPPNIYITYNSTLEVLLSHTQTLLYIFTSQLPLNCYFHNKLICICTSGYYWCIYICVYIWFCVKMWEKKSTWRSKGNMAMSKKLRWIYMIYYHIYCYFQVWLPYIELHDVSGVFGKVHPPPKTYIWIIRALICFI